MLAAQMVAPTSRRACHIIRVAWYSLAMSHRERPHPVEELLRSLLILGHRPNGAGEACADTAEAQTER